MSISFNFSADLLSTLSFVVSSGVAILTYLNLKEFKKSNLEDVRAQIVFFIEKNHPTLGYSLVIKNFGKSTGKVLDIKIDPEIQYPDNLVAKGILLDYKNVLLAPGQAIVSSFDFKNYTNETFTVYIKYQTCNKVFEDSYDIKFSMLKKLVFKVPESYNEVDGLDQINRTLLGISNKLSS
ncbi:hypothetical protein GOD95_11320 [Paeniclostridium sordellii]|uniref:hypothetical protein n=1 Tax=Paraclostridium sordellii TaxID=1505 RepID=UPI0012EE03E6|nr:hypothetical protein [Paeniclostridium sordellii]MDU6247476.1 hypothetical protein [Paeniclostridium sordellii]MVO72034.1 hypothetical protein [Paeniclostridium sordellii]